MAIAFVGAANTFGFADGDTGHTCTHATGAPSVDDLDILLINSNTVLDSVTSSAGAAWTQRVDATSNQGAYLYSRKATGGEPADVVVNTSGNHNTDVIWLRFSGTDAYDPPGGSPVSVINNTNGTTLGALTTGTLPATGMLVVAAGLLHNFDGTLSTSPVWINGFTAAGAVSSGTDGSSSATVAFGGYKLNVGTADEDVGGSLSWTNNARNRYGMFGAFTAAGGTDATVTASTVNASTSLPAATVATGSTVTAAAISTVATLPTATVATGSTAIPATISAVATLPDPSLSTGSTITAAAVSAAATLPSPTVSAESPVTPAAITVTVTLPAVSLSAGSTVTPAAVAASASMPAPAVGAAVRATSTPVVSAGRTSTAAVTARRTSTPTVTGG